MLHVGVCWRRCSSCVLSARGFTPLNVMLVMHVSLRFVYITSCSVWCLMLLLSRSLATYHRPGSMHLALALWQVQHTAHFCWFVLLWVTYPPCIVVYVLYTVVRCCVNQFVYQMCNIFCHLCN